MQRCLPAGEKVKVVPRYYCKELHCLLGLRTWAGSSLLCFCALFSPPKDHELHHLVITTAKAAFDLHIPKKPYSGHAPWWGSDSSLPPAHTAWGSGELDSTMGACLLFPVASPSSSAPYPHQGSFSLASVQGPACCCCRRLQGLFPPFSAPASHITHICALSLSVVVLSFTTNIHSHSTLPAWSLLLSTRLFINAEREDNCSHPYQQRVFFHAFVISRAKHPSARQSPVTSAGQPRSSQKQSIEVVLQWLTISALQRQGSHYPRSSRSAEVRATHWLRIKAGSSTRHRFPQTAIQAPTGILIMNCVLASVSVIQYQRKAKQALLFYISLYLQLV